jgi:hypothetical protein
MRLIVGPTIMVLAGLCWGGQVLSWLAPETAVRWGFMESETDVEPVFWADLLAEARWDAAVLWSMVVAGGLLTIDHASWPYFGLVAGGGYLYFAGRGIAARLTMRGRQFRIGSPGNVTTGIIALAVWGAMAAAVIVGAIVELEGR